MIYHIISFLLAAITVAAILQPTRERTAAAMVFVGLLLVHEISFKALDGFAYYASAALFDLMAVAMLSRISDPSGLVVGLQKVCIASIVTNGAGWLIWWAYFPPHGYDLAFIGLFIWALYILTKGIGLNVGTSKHIRRSGFLSSATDESRIHLQNHEGET